MATDPHHQFLVFSFCHLKKLRQHKIQLAKREGPSLVAKDLGYDLRSIPIILDPGNTLRLGRSYVTNIHRMQGNANNSYKMACIFLLYSNCDCNYYVLLPLVGVSKVTCIIPVFKALWFVSSRI